jgi:CRISPR-associated Csx2 family protein
MKAITFIGTGNYQETQIEFAGKHFKTALFPAILPQFFPQLQQIIVFVTSKAKQHDNFTLAAKELGGLMRAVDIPDGHSEEELWKIFDAMIENVQPGDELVFDITHSFRSLPFITFLVAAFLRIAREVTVNHVLYGAFEARNEQTGISPVFDLSPFIQLLDWTVATQQFLETGNAQNIAKFLEREGKDQKIGVLKERWA